MAGLPDPMNRTSAFVRQMKADLEQARRDGMNPPIERRKLRTIAGLCGLRRASRPFLARLHDAVAEAGIHTAPGLNDDALRADDWVRFSTEIIPESHAFFPNEEALRQFVKLAIQQRAGMFRNLQLVGGGRGSKAVEVTLPSRNRIDLLCHERTRSGAGALVAIELKTEHDRGATSQLLEYMDELRTLNPGRDVKGMIIEGRAGRVTPGELLGTAANGISWHVYDVAFRDIASGPGAS